MPTAVQFRRGTTTQNNNFTGALGEISIDTDLDVIRVHDGSTLGGAQELVGKTAIQTLTNKTLSSATLTGTLTAGGSAGTSGQYLQSTGTGIQWVTLSSNKISTNNSNVTVDTSWVNVAVNGSNVAGFGSGGLILAGNLTVQGTTTTVNSTTLDIADLNITVAKGAATAAAANGAGLTVDGASATILYTSATDSFNFNKTIIGTVLNVSGNVLSTGAVLNSLTVNGAGTVTGAITINSSNAVTAIVNGGTNGVGNIGASGQGFNTVFAKATTAQYADLAEYYVSDSTYEAGTVVEFGGSQELTQASNESTKVAGVVSTQPAFFMNDALEVDPILGQYKVCLALQGRVPCKVTGTITKGDMLVSAGNGRAKASSNPKLGSVIGKSLVDFTGTDGIIEVVVGRL